MAGRKKGSGPRPDDEEVEKAEDEEVEDTDEDEDEDEDADDEDADEAADIEEEALEDDDAGDGATPMVCAIIVHMLRSVLITWSIISVAIMARSWPRRRPRTSAQCG